ncbi:acyl-CoA dehydrogenase [Streptomyces capoamus]|uniref:Acyl-CoA dehydrogenase n=1 Tax=Streptomyces capoamus TaxID=68183 RepID=A0A919F3I9_9ACTN|nr:acyl-CoA dehydrogenase family protein [Streptomyces capoamus]GGP32548.1 acyl-CoA dehydrogenase [Streptomyces libani subsp. rufus]GHG75582.1 acyl-CoA dehydrogenase [Streptomyces capoamus]
MEPNSVPRPTRRLIAELEELLGDPLDSSGPFSFAEIVAHEERDAIPPGAVETLRAWGLTNCLVPQSVGGTLLNLESAQALIRSVARRNLTVAVKFGSSALGAQPLWLWGTPEQRKLVAEGVLAGDAVCFGVSEAAAGSDVAATATTARRDGDTYVLDGEKWPVGNATQGRFVTVLARGPRGPMLLLADKEDLPPGSWTPRPRVRTVGLRGHDLSGIALHGARVPADAVIGRPGRGHLDMVRCLQITRTAIGGMSLGTMDAALRIGLDYVHERRLYGRPILHIPVVREHLVGAHLDLLAAECTAIPVARALSVVPARMALWSSVVKYLVPVIGEEVLEHVAKVLGARGYLRELVASGAFQKIRRDHAITTIFEGTTHVNLHLIATQLTALAEVHDRPSPGSEQVLSDLFDLSRDAPVWVPDGDGLVLTTGGSDEIVRSWRGALTELAGQAASRCTPQQAADLAEVTAALDRRRSALYGTVAERGIDAGSVVGSRAAAEHCVHHAAASCVQVWLHNQGAEPDAGWLVLVLRRLLQRLDPAVLLDEEERYLPRFEAVMERCRAEGRYYSLDAVLE